ncbi:MAG: hypothetical protein V4724_02450 [Pseudomonadota bacterium]
MHTIPHPTKEQVRAYMLQRGRAHRPPPAPDEIRRQLGWYLHSSSQPPCVILPSGQFSLVLPSTMAQLTALMAVEWLFLASGMRHRR